MRCPRCGNENPGTNRFCGMCGATLLPSTPTQSPAAAPPAARPVAPVTTAPTAPMAARPATPPSEESPVISGPSFLGLNQPPLKAARPAKSNQLSIDPDAAPSRPNLEYLLEDDEPRRGGAGKFVLILVALALAAGLGYLRWRNQGFGWLSSGRGKPSAAVQNSDSGDANAGPPSPAGGNGATAPSASQPDASQPSVSQPSAGTTPPAANPAGGASPNPAASGSPAAGGPTTAGGAVSGGASNAAAPPAASQPSSTPSGNESAANPSSQRSSQSSSDQSSSGQTSSDQPASNGAGAGATAGASADQPADQPAHEPAHEPKTATVEKPAPSPEIKPVKPADPVAEAQKYIYGRGGVAQSCDRGMRILKPAAERSNPKAMIEMGALYSAGLCAPRDLPTAYRWFAMALRKDPDNQAVQTDLEKLWGEMTQPERQLAMKLSQ